VIRKALFLVTLIVATLLLGGAAIVGGLLDRRRVWVRHVAPLWSRSILWAAGVKISVHGGATPSPCVFVANHRSNLDVAVLGAILPHETLWLAKRELFAVPVFGSAMRAVGYLSVDRDHGESARATVLAAAEEVARGTPVVIFPEGTRGRDGELLPFKMGFAHLAESSGAPVVPVAIQGTARLWPRGRLVPRAGEVSVAFLPPAVFPPTEDSEVRRARVEAVRETLARALEAA